MLSPEKWRRDYIIYSQILWLCSEERKQRNPRLCPRRSSRKICSPMMLSRRKIRICLPMRAKKQKRLRRENLKLTRLRQTRLKLRQTRPRLKLRRQRPTRLSTRQTRLTLKLKLKRWGLWDLTATARRPVSEAV